MIPPMLEFYGPETPSPSGWIARIPKGISEKMTLFRTVAGVLRFPAYFGMNWAALDECLADLEWIDSSAVWLWHEDIPLISNRAEAHTYLSIIAEVADEPGSAKLHVAFPECLKDAVMELLSSDSASVPG